jgi:hypothetical protein
MSNADFSFIPNDIYIEENFISLLGVDNGKGICELWLINDNDGELNKFYSLQFNEIMPKFAFLKNFDKENLYFAILDEKKIKIYKIEKNNKKLSQELEFFLR